MATQAKLEGNKRYHEKLDRIVIQPHKEDGDKIRAAAAVAGKSVQRYILDILEAHIADPKAPG